MTFVELTEHKHAGTVRKNASSLLGTVPRSISRLADLARGGAGETGRDTIFPSPATSCLGVGDPHSGFTWPFLKVLLPILSPGYHREWDKGIMSMLQKQRELDSTIPLQPYHLGKSTQLPDPQFTHRYNGSKIHPIYLTS